MRSVAANARRMHHAATSGASTSAAKVQICVSRFVSGLSWNSSAAAIHSRQPRAKTCNRPVAMRHPGASSTTSARTSSSAVAGDAVLRAVRLVSAAPAADSAINNRNATPARPTQSPQATISVAGGSPVCTSPIRIFCSSIAVLATTVPVASMTALTPLLVTRSCGIRVSMLRNAATARCKFAPAGWPVNQESLDMPRIACAPSRRPSIARSLFTSSRQISGATGISRPSANCSGNTRAPSPRFQVPAHGIQRRKVGPSSHCGTDSVNRNRSVLR